MRRRAHSDRMTRILDATADRDEWLERWRACGRDPFAHPSYAQLFEADRARAAAYVLDYMHGSALLPILIRPIRPLSRTQGHERDVISPYGYGGPFFSGQAEPELVLRGVAN